MKVLDVKKMTDKNLPQKPSWDHINNDLKNALDTWTELTEQLEEELSPEEKQLQEIKALLGTLKDKLQEFNEK